MKTKLLIIIGIGILGFSTMILISQASAESISYADPIFERCYDDDNCTIDMLYELSQTNSTQTVFLTIDELVDLYVGADFYCHPAAHHLGEFLYGYVNRDLRKASHLSDYRCASGIMHGLIENNIQIENMLDGTPIEKVDIEEPCRIVRDSLGDEAQNECIHGMGHSLIKFYNYNTTQALERCNEFDDSNEIYMCDGGLFMQNIGEYVDTATTYYDSEVSTVDFVGTQGVDTINQWVANKTSNKIKTILVPGSTDAFTRLIITNAIYFKGTWVIQFNEADTKDQDFMVASDSIVKTPMMNLFQSKQLYGETEKIKILELPYEGDRLSMLLLLPKETNGVSELENSLTLENLAKWREYLSPRPVQTLSIPKFELETTYPLIPPLKNLGLEEAFDAQKANFSGIIGSEPLYISSAIHKAFVDVNEEGTEAAAVTAIGIATSSGKSEPPPVYTFVADHPFLFIIQDNSNGNILFIGKMANPSK